MNNFLALHGQFCHAVELNGLRNWDENREVAALAEKWNQILISGGDRHGVEPNANLNLTRAKSFTEFVHEVRRERQSHVLFMPQYAEPWKQRILNSTLAAIRNYPDFPEGSQCWDDRVYHPDAEGKLRTAFGALDHWARPGLSRGSAGRGSADGHTSGLERTAPGMERCERDAGGAGAEELACGLVYEGLPEFDAVAFGIGDPREAAIGGVLAFGIDGDVGGG